MKVLLPETIHPEFNPFDFERVFWLLIWEECKRNEKKCVPAGIPMKIVFDFGLLRA
jgi:hypothetical protein